MAEPGTPESETKPKIPEFKLPPTGTHVRVERSSGEIELGWVLAAKNPVDNKITITHPISGDNEHALIKRVTDEEFIRQNPVPGIDDVNTFEELENAVKRVSFVQGSQETYTNKELLKIIDQVKKGEADINTITKSGGLRDKVTGLLAATQSI